MTAVAVKVGRCMVAFWVRVGKGIVPAVPAVPAVFAVFAVPAVPAVPAVFVVAVVSALAQLHTKNCNAASRRL